MSKTGRNSPCPCGSGKKYKHCCIGSNVVPIGIASDDETPDSGEQAFKLPPHLAEMFPDLEAKLQGADMNAPGELEAIFASTFESQNDSPVSDFHGLNSGQMNDVLYRPLEACDWFDLMGEMPDELDWASFLYVFLWIAEALGEKGLKASTKGEMPRKLCREVDQRFQQKYGPHRYSFGHTGINSETDFRLLHIVRLTAQKAGLMRLYGGKFMLCKKAQKYLSKTDHGGLYRELFNSYVGPINWQYVEQYDSSPFIQQSWLFSLYLLRQHGDQERPVEEYIDWFIQAFPMVMEEIPATSSSAPATEFRRQYVSLVLLCLWDDFGLAEVRMEMVKDGYGLNYFVSKTKLVDLVLRVR